MPRHATATSFQIGQSGNPRGRAPGTRNKVTRDAREAAQRIVDDPEYREALRARMIDGSAGPMEALMWFYAKGKPSVNNPLAPNQVERLSTVDLVIRLRAALNALDAIEIAERLDTRTLCRD
jgi:phage FluMu protein gp41